MVLPTTSSLWAIPCTTMSPATAAYVVVPATMTFTVQGKKVTQTGAVFTVALRKLAEGGASHAWAWAKGKHNEDREELVFRGSAEADRRRTQMP